MVIYWKWFKIIENIINYIKSGWFIDINKKNKLYMY